MNLQKISFDDLTVVTIGGSRSAESYITKGQYEILKIFDPHKRGRRKKITEEVLVQIYVALKGDNYIPKIMEINNSHPINKNYSTITYHYLNQTPEWKYVLKARVRNYFAGAVGRLIIKGSMKAITSINLDKIEIK